jgi:hypothetical protein
MPVFSPPPVSKQETKKFSSGLLIAVVMGGLVNNTMTKANNNFSPYRDNEAESTHGVYKISLLRMTSQTRGRSLSVSLQNTLYIKSPVDLRLFTEV